MVVHTCNLRKWETVVQIQSLPELKNKTKGSREYPSVVEHLPNRQRVNQVPRGVGVGC